MNRIIVVLSVLVSCAQVGASAQSLDELIKSQLAEVQSNLAQLNWGTTPLNFNFYERQRSKTGATEALQTGLQGTWWRDASWIKALELTPDQQRKMDDAFQQNRIRLIDLTAALEKEEVILEPLIENIHAGDEARIQAQIDKVADARAGLEKANARMLLSIRETLSQEQWNKLQENRKKSIRIPNIKITPFPPAPPSPPATPAPPASK
jgi:Spy/CpxP family protein refolding chaperone